MLNEQLLLNLHELMQCFKEDWDKIPPQHVRDGVIQ